MTDQLTAEHAIQWCVTHRASVTFMHAHGEDRVALYFSGATMIERETFIQAVSDARTKAQERPQK